MKTVKELRDELDELPDNERMERFFEAAINMSDITLVLAQALIHYGQHEETCTDEEICNCKLSPLQHMCVKILTAKAMCEKEDGAVN